MSHQRDDLADPAVLRAALIARDTPIGVGDGLLPVFLDIYRPEIKPS